MGSDHASPCSYYWDPKQGVATEEGAGAGGSKPKQVDAEELLRVAEENAGVDEVRCAACLGRGGF
jgi:hypothetical protein